MDNYTEIIRRLDNLYKEYQDKSSSLSPGKTDEVVLLLAKLTGAPNSDTKVIAEQLSRFSAKISQMYFDTLTKTTKPSIELLDELLNYYLLCSKDSKQPQHYVPRYTNTILPIIRNYNNSAFVSKNLPKLVSYIAHYAINSDTAKDKFQLIIQKTKGAIYHLDYTVVEKESLTDIWKATNLLTDSTKDKFESFIIEWGKKYGFITPSANEKQNSTDNKVKIEESVVAKETPNEEATAAVQSPVNTESVNPTPKKEEPKAAITNDDVSEKKEKTITESVSAKNDAPAEKPIAVSESKKADTLVEKPVAVPESKKADAPTEKSVAVPESKKADAPAEKQVAVPKSKKADAPAEKPVAVSESKKADAPAEKQVDVPVSKKSEAPAEKPVASVDEKASNNTSDATISEKSPARKSSAQVLYERLKHDMDKEQEAIITAFADMLTPVEKAFESIQGEINKSRAVGAENVSLKTKIEDLERQLSEQKARLQTANQSLVSAKTENEELKKQISSLESQNAELDSKLNDAYAINSRESSLEAEKIRSELKKAFAFLYEDWLEYEFSDVSEENYESLQAIIKKIFRSLERNGIDFKGNN